MTAAQRDTVLSFRSFLLLIVQQLDREEFNLSSVRSLSHSQQIWDSVGATHSITGSQINARQASWKQVKCESITMIFFFLLPASNVCVGVNTECPLKDFFWGGFVKSNWNLCTVTGQELALRYCSQRCEATASIKNGDFSFSHFFLDGIKN